MVDEITFKLTEKDKAHLKKRLEQVKPEDEERVRTKFGGKLQSLEDSVKDSDWVPDFIASLISDVKFLYEMMCDEDYTISWQTKAQIIFALAYFISPLDLIPDAIIGIGYLDDALVVAWVCHNLKDEIQDYKRFLKQQVEV